MMFVLVAGWFFTGEKWLKYLSLLFTIFLLLFVYRTVCAFVKYKSRIIIINQFQFIHNFYTISRIIFLLNFYKKNRIFFANYTFEFRTAISHVFLRMNRLEIARLFC